MEKHTNRTEVNQEEIQVLMGIRKDIVYTYNA